MILSKQNLLIYSIPEQDRGIPVLNNVHVTADGATLAANSKSFVCVSPVTDVVKKSLPIDDPGPIGEFSISIGLSKEVCGAMPSDSQFGGLTEHVGVSEEESELRFETTDGKRKKSMLGKKFERAYIQYKNFLRKIFSRQDRKVKLVLNRKRLLALVGVLEKLCSDKTGNSLIFMEVTQDDELILRSSNPRTGQNVAAFMSSYSKSEEDWIINSWWENKWKETAKINK